MINKGIEDLLEKLIADEREIIVTKGAEYTMGNIDRLHSFKHSAEVSGVTPLQVCMIYLNKHYQSVSNYVKIGKELSNESLHSRILDLRVYLLLLEALTIDAKEEKCNQ